MIYLIIKISFRSKSRSSLRSQASMRSMRSARPFQRSSRSCSLVGRQACGRSSRSSRGGGWVGGWVDGVKYGELQWATSPFFDAGFFWCQIVETKHVVTMNDLETQMDGSRRVYIYISNYTNTGKYLNDPYLLMTCTWGLAEMVMVY